MAHSRLLSAVTTTFLILGLSIGGGAAVAAEESLEPQTTVGVETEGSPPAAATDSGASTTVAKLLVVESPVADALTSSLVGAELAAECEGDDCEVQASACVVAIWKMPSWVNQWTPTWPQSFVSVHNSDCSTTQIIAADFPVPDDCGTQYQLDKYYASEKTTALIAGGILLGYGPEEDLVPGTWGTLVKNPDCDAAPIEVVAAFTPMTCDSESGSFTVGVVDPADVNAGSLAWTTTDGTVPSDSANIVADPGVVTVTVRVADEYLAGVVVEETSTLGVSSMISVDGVETRLITWSFTFAAPDDCELETEVVPLVSQNDYCVGSGPDALRVATFTLADVDNLSYRYTINGGSDIDIDFRGDDEVRISVNPGDVVVLIAMPGAGFALPFDWKWSHEFVGAAFCPETLPATVAAADIIAADCDGAATIVTVTNDGGVVWNLNGEIVDGNATHEVSAGSSMVLTASLDEGWTWSDPEQQTAWSDDGSSQEGCQAGIEGLAGREGLAVTGAAPATEWLGIVAALMVLVGLSVVGTRRTRTG